MNKTRLSLHLAALATAAAVGLINLGCEVGNPNETIRNVSINFSGYYANGSTPIVSHNSGLTIRNLKLMQTGDQLQAFDNNNARWTGEVEDPINGVAAFALRGNNSLGQSATISGTLTLNGGSSSSTNGGSSTSTDATMRGNYFEDRVVSTVYGVATVPGQTGNGGGGGGGTNSSSLAISPSSVTLSIGASQTFSASGGSGSYSWSASPTGLGELTSSGSQANFKRTASGTITLTVTDSNNSTATASVN